ncbi:MAG: lytic transglycosylase domain-containing protein [Actinobacteria bacterium]|nr:lytic transglycosylase domain-containing protein [Actinomycetota bacterium]
MRSTSSSVPDRRARRLTERRTRRRPAIIAAGLAFGLLAVAGTTTTAPAVQAQATLSPSSFSLASYSTPLVSVTGTTDKTSADAATALNEATAALASATAVTADITASGLDIGVPDPTIDTIPLRAAVARLDTGAAVLPSPLVPDLTDDVTTLVASLDGRVAGLRASLDAAKAAKAQQEAAAQAQAAAAAAAKKAAATKATTTSTSTTPPPAAASSGASGDNSPAGAQATARGMLASYGWGDDQFGCLVSLWNKESGWRVGAANSSGAYGIPQALPGSKMASAGADWRTSAATQIAWGFGYISGRYGTPCGAWAKSQSSGWY